MAELLTQQGLWLSSARQNYLRVEHPAAKESCIGALAPRKVWLALFEKRAQALGEVFALKHPRKMDH